MRTVLMGPVEEQVNCDNTKATHRISKGNLIAHSPGCCCSLTGINKSPRSTFFLYKCYFYDDDDHCRCCYCVGSLCSGWYLLIRFFWYVFVRLLIITDTGRFPCPFAARRQSEWPKFPFDDRLCTRWKKWAEGKSHWLIFMKHTLEY